MVPPTDGEIAVVIQRLSDIERRLADGEDDIKNLARSNSELTAAIAGLTAKIAALPTGMVQINHQQNERMLTLLGTIADRLQIPASPRTAPSPVVAGGAGTAVGALAMAIYAYVAGHLGLPR